MILSVMQPTYIPWLGYFDLINSADQFVFLDDVKLEKSDWHVRNRIKSAQGEVMLSQVVTTPCGRMNSTICSTSFKKGNPWRKKHLKTMKMNYQRADFFEEVYSMFVAYYETGSENLADFNVGLIEQILKKLEINTPIARSSQIKGLKGTKDERLANLALFYGACDYLSPWGAKDYIEKLTPGGALAKSGIEVYYQRFQHPEYKQQYYPFTSHLAIIDALMNLGFDETKNIILKGHQTPMHFSKLYT